MLLYFTFYIIHIGFSSEKILNKVSLKEWMVPNTVSWNCLLQVWERPVVWEIFEHARSKSFFGDFNLCPQALVERTWHFPGSILGCLLDNYQCYSAHYIQFDSKNIHWVLCSQHRYKNSPNNNYNNNHVNNNSSNYHLLRTHRVRHCLKHFTWIILFNLYNNPIKLYVLIFSCGKWSLETLRNLSVATHLIKIDLTYWARIWIQGLRFKYTIFFSHRYVIFRWWNCASERLHRCFRVLCIFPENNNIYDLSNVSYMTSMLL